MLLTLKGNFLFYNFILYEYSVLPGSIDVLTTKITVLN